MYDVDQVLWHPHVLYQLLTMGGGQYHVATNILSIFTILTIMIGFKHHIN